MARVLISYDIEKVAGVHDYVKDEMKKLGYFDCFIVKVVQVSYLHYLPNTTLWHTNKTTAQARQDLKDVLNKFQTNGAKLLESAFGTNIENYSSFYRDTKQATAKEIETIPEM